MLKISRIGSFYAKNRQEPKLTPKQQKFEFLYGVNPIQLALAAGRRTCDSLLISDSQTINTSSKAAKIIMEAKEKNIALSFTPKERMDRLSKNQPHQNMILRCSQLSPLIAKDPNEYQNGLYVYCDKITDPQNFGAIIRSSLFFGVANIFTPKKAVCPLNSTVSKTSAGALELLEVHTIQKDEQFLEGWKRDNGIVISTSVNSQTSQPLSLNQCPGILQKHKKVMLILGSEGYGVSPHLARHSNFSLTIDRRGKDFYPYQLVDSLNVNAALTCILYQLTRKIAIN